MTHVVVVTLTATFLLLALDRSGELGRKQFVYVPPALKVEDLPDGKGREITFYTCTACHGVALIKAQGLTRDLWDSTFDLMLEKHRMPPVKAAERAEILDYLAEQFPPRRKGRGSDNPFLK